ncbi:MAG: DUF2520 domain-containing protein [Candidatus Electryoneaceae bacterium]|nr:DUF2520 domain-containing protein [Candidatus Electryoneaceae bacterium]
MKQTVVVIGHGKVGRVLVRAFAAKGYPLHQGLENLSSDVDFVVLSVPDRYVGQVADEIVSGRKLRTGSVVAHTSGSLSTEPLDSVRTVGALPLAWHPLQTFTGSEGPELLHGTTFGIEGDPDAVQIGEEIARDLGGIPFRTTPELRSLYHLGAVFSCNLMAALVGMSLDLLGEAGMDEETALQALKPLMSQTLDNIFQLGLPQSITGPVSRGDDRTIRSHLEILSQYPQAQTIYRLLSRELLHRLNDPQITDKLLSLLNRKA